MILSMHVSYYENGLSTIIAPENIRDRTDWGADENLDSIRAEACRSGHGFPACPLKEEPELKKGEISSGRDPAWEGDFPRLEEPVREGGEEHPDRRIMESRNGGSLSTGSCPGKGGEPGQPRGSSMHREGKRMTKTG